jgi:hypothetical protein
VETVEEVALVVFVEETTGVEGVVVVLLLFFAAAF